MKVFFRTPRRRKKKKNVEFYWGKFANCDSGCLHLSTRRTWCGIIQSNDERRRHYSSFSSRYFTRNKGKYFLLLLLSRWDSQFFCSSNFRMFNCLTELIIFNWLNYCFSCSNISLNLVSNSIQMLGKTNSLLTPSNQPLFNLHSQSTPNVAFLSFDDQVELCLLHHHPPFFF